jgi:hypothetical protein
MPFILKRVVGSSYHSPSAAAGGRAGRAPAQMPWLAPAAGGRPHTAARRSSSGGALSAGSWSNRTAAAALEPGGVMAMR